MSRVGRVFAAAVVVVLAVAATTVAAAAPTGTTSTGTDTLTIDLATGALGPTSPSGIPVTDPIVDVALSPSGTLFGVTDGTTKQLWSFSSAGVATSVGNLGVSAGNAGLTFTADGRLWMVSGVGLYSVNPSTGAATLLGTDPAAVSAFSGVAGGCGSVLYAIRFNSTTGFGELVRIDASGATPTFTVVGSLGVATNSPKLAFDAAGVLWGKSSGGGGPGTYTIDTSTGAATVIVGTAGSNPGLTIAAPQCTAPNPAPPTPVISSEALRFTG